MNVVGVIPARGGSKSIPLKNIKPVNGKPLIEFSIETALKVKSIDKLIVSSDHDKIISICRKFKNIQIVKRPDKLSTDTSSTELALLHACDYLIENDGFTPDIVLTLEPTSPLRKKETIEKCIDILKNTDADSVIGVVEENSCIGTIVDQKFEFIFKNQPRRRQDRKPLYKESSTIYGTKYDVLKKKKSVIGDFVFPLIIEKDEAFDINEPVDMTIINCLASKAN